MNEATLYLVCGLPGAGKTTRARQIVERVNAVHLNPDDWIVELGVSLVDYDVPIQAARPHAGARGPDPALWREHRHRVRLLVP